MNENAKTAIVTGASRGIGKQIAKQLAALGIQVVVNYARSATAAEELVSELNKNGGTAVAVQADITRPNEVKRLFDETIAHFGKVDILVNNAGLMITQTIDQVTEEDFDRQFLTNVKGTYFACQQAFQSLSDNGRIINISTSVNGQMFPGYSVYAATKGAVEQLTRQLAKEFGKKKITINAIAPGPVATELFLKGKSEEAISHLSQMNALGRLGEPEDIANSIELLIDDKAQWVTGQTIRVNGGFI
jgi:3-oxoacyl-[acyl-carrier protein] reductase